MAKAPRKGTRSAKSGTDIPKHKVFISYHDCDADRPYKDRFIELLKGSIIDKSVHDDDIDDDQLKVDGIQQKIRNHHVATSDVTVVLIGRCTWTRKHVDWEIHASLRDTKNNARNGVVGILLKHHECYEHQSVNSGLIPPRLADNLQGDNPFAKLYNWPSKKVKKKLLRWIGEGFDQRCGHPPTNNRSRFGENQKGNCIDGWQPDREYPKQLPIEQ